MERGNELKDSKREIINERTKRRHSERGHLRLGIKEHVISTVTSGHEMTLTSGQ